MTNSAAFTVLNNEKGTPARTFWDHLLAAAQLHCAIMLGHLIAMYTECVAI